MELVNPDIERYAENHTSDESPAVKALIKESERELQYTGMLSGRVVGQLLAMLVRITGAKRILELGTFTGHSALCMAEALPEKGSLITCDTNARYEAIARAAFEQSEYGHKIELRMGPALQTIQPLNQSFDLIFIDADKTNYMRYYQSLLPKLRAGGLLAIDNVLWGGQVLAPDDSKARTIHALNERIAEDERVEQVMLTIRDGLTLVRKKE
jgi:caffeoyl-CoA O-methyltransferase